MMTWGAFILFFLGALLYASVGHGGASAYLAIMALSGTPTALAKQSALILNIAVAGISFIQYYRQGHFSLKLFWPFAVASLPMAFLGGLTPISSTQYKYFLAAALVLAALCIVWNPKATEKEHYPTPPFYLCLIVGALIGYASGLLGIGGGILLSPVIMLAGWAGVKQTAAVSAAFIWVNSVAGLLGAALLGPIHLQTVALYVLPAIAGGYIGATLGSRWLQSAVLRYLLAAVMLVAVIKLIL